MLTSREGISLRGLSVVNEDVVWVSGTQGTVGRSIDGGKTWEWSQVPGYEKIDFRDIEAFDKKNAVIMGVASPAYILRTFNGGKSWKKVFENDDPKMFLDAMEFWNDRSGIVIGDPIKGRFFIGRTFDGGRNWQTIPEKFKPLADSGEACFAASGTNICELDRDEAVFVTGGLVSNFFVRDQKINLPLIQGTATTGANSVAVKNKNTIIVVGGDFNKKKDTTLVCAISTDGGLTWKNPINSPNGYRSCVAYITKDTWITCGLNGVDISTDDGNTWKPISDKSFHVCRRAMEGKKIFFLAGTGGRVAVLKMEE